MVNIVNDLAILIRRADTVAVENVLSNFVKENVGKKRGIFLHFRKINIVKLHCYVSNNHLKYVNKFFYNKI